MSIKVLVAIFSQILCSYFTRNVNWNK